MGFSPFFFGANKKMLNKRADKLELLRIAEAVALEKSIDKELIITSMEKLPPLEFTIVRSLLTKCNRIIVQRRRGSYNGY